LRHVIRSLYDAMTFSSMNCHTVQHYFVDRLQINITKG
jgi:hypothetical protein